MLENEEYKSLEAAKVMLKDSYNAGNMFSREREVQDLDLAFEKFN